MRGEQWIPAEIRTAMERAWRFVIWRHRSNFSADMWLGYVISVEGDRPQRKLVEGTEMVKWPFRSCDLLARRSAKRCLMGSTDQVRRSFKL
jgi:hypothetical protein